MKKAILITLIFLAASSLKSQSVPYNPEWITVTKDCLIFNLPVNFDIVMPHGIPEKKSPQWGDLKVRIKEIPHLKTKIVSLALIGAWGYAFRHDLKRFSVKNDKLCHLVLSYGLSKYFGWKFALGFMLSIEATQSDIFGTEGRYEDTIEDLFVDFVGIGFSLNL